MNHAKRTLVCLVLAGCCWLGAATPASARPQGAAGVRQVERTAQQAYRVYKEARWVADATRRYSHMFRPDVGRWVQLARCCRWPKRDMYWLMRQMDQESKGQPDCNPDGLLQITAPWHDGSDPSAAALFKSHHLSYPWDATDPRQTFLHARVMPKSNWWIVGAMP